MTMPQLPDLREAFEAYFANSRRGRGVKKIPVFKRLPDDSYADEPTQRHWWTWQNAARAAIAAHVPEAAFGNIAAVPAQPVTLDQIQAGLVKTFGEPFARDDVLLRRIAEAIHAAAPQAVPVPAWQPIETAPKDRDVLVACSHGLYVARYCEHDIEWWHVDDNKHGPFPLRGSSPTHWQPLPAAPKEQPHE